MGVGVGLSPAVGYEVRAVGRGGLYGNEHLLAVQSQDGLFRIARFGAGVFRAFGRVLGGRFFLRFDAVVGWPVGCAAGKDIAPFKGANAEDPTAWLEVGGVPRAVRPLVETEST